MALQIGGVSLSGLDASKDPAAVFQALATAYRFDEKIAKHLVETVGLDNLLDFVHVVTCEGEWEPIIARVPDLEQRAGQLSRVRQAWKAVRDSAQEAENRKKRGLDESDDATLPAQQLVVLSVTFHARYKLSFPAAWEPSELLISKINRELSKRQLTVISVWKVRSIVCAAKAPRKRQKVGDVEILSGEREDPDHTKDLKTYIALHLVLMVGYARAGIRAVEPIPSEPEKSSSDPTDYVEVSMCLAARQGGLARAWRRAQVPLDTALAYHYRLVALANALPYKSALQFISRRDEEERAWWTDRVRTSTLNLGKIIREGLQTREIMWSPPPTPVASAPERPAPGNRAGPGGGGGGGGGSGHGAQFGDKLKDGTLVCRKFNMGQCSEPCPRGYKHVCNVIVNASGRLCAMSNHCALTCTKKMGGSAKGGAKGGKTS